MLKPNEAMVDEAARSRGTAAAHRAGRDVRADARVDARANFPSDLTVVPILAEGALAALDAGDGARHDCARRAGRVAGVARRRRRRARAVQPRARAGAVAKVVQVPVLTTPASAVRALRARFVRG